MARHQPPSEPGPWATASAAEPCPEDRADRDRKLLSVVFVWNMGQKAAVSSVGTARGLQEACGSSRACFPQGPAKGLRLRALFSSQGRQPQGASKGFSYMSESRWDTNSDGSGVKENIQLHKNKLRGWAGPGRPAGAQLHHSLWLGHGSAAPHTDLLLQRDPC